MSKFLVAFVLLAFPGCVTAQSNIIDSLKAVLVHAKDTNKVNALNRLASAHWYSDPGATLQYASESIKLATSLGFKRGLASAYNNMGVAHYQQNNYERALEWYNKALAVHRETGNFTGEGFILSNIGLIYWKQGQLSTAVEYYLKSLAIWDKHKIESEKAGVYDNIGNVYNEQENYDQALEYYFKALSIEREHKLDRHFQSMTLSNIGTAFLAKSDLSKALEYFFASLRELDEEEKESRGVALSNIGLTYLDMKKYDSADYYLQKALTLQEEIGDTDAMLHTLLGKAKTAQHRNNIAEGFLFVNRARSLAEEINDNAVLEEIWMVLSDLSFAKNNYKDAYDYYKKYVAARDSISSKENIYRIAHLQAGFETQKKQAQIEAMQEQQEQLAFRRNAVVAGLAGLLIITVLIVSRQRLRIKKNTELETINKQLRQQSAILEQQTNKLRELDRVKSTFFANISHEFRTPLTLILNSLADKMRLVQENGNGDEMAQLEVMNRNARRLLNLINQLLDLSKLDAGKMKLTLEDSDLKHLITTIYSSFNSLAVSREIDFKLSVPEEQVHSRVDVDKLEKIIYNLLSNAFKFTPIGGKIMLALSIMNDHIAIVVEDSGQGIASGQLDKIFDRFYQGDQYHSDEQGTGIGLALTKELVELHNGHIQAENYPMGARFVVTLPFLHADTLSGSPSKTKQADDVVHKVMAVPIADGMKTGIAPPRTKDAPKSSILVVEDSLDLRKYMSRHLAQDYDVLESENGISGFDQAVAEMPELIITDWMMPEMDGITLCKRLKSDERTSHIPVIILTALASDEAKLQGLGSGADDYLTKPFDSRELGIRVKNLIESRRLLREKFSRELQLAPSRIPVSSMDEKFLSRVMETVETYMGEPEFDMDRFGKEVGLSRMQLHRKLKAITGHSPGDFLRTMRLKRAKQLLEARAGNVSEVAYQVGFNNLSYFSKCYREQYNISPLETFSANVTILAENVTK